MNTLSVRLKLAMIRRPHTSEELAEIISELDRIIHDIEQHQINLSRAWLRKHPRESERKEELP
jgi:hypothetical protein